MGAHVHVRLIQSLGVTEEGELIEYSSCAECGATWVKKYPEGQVPAPD
ncbi:hypothetical protein [Streptomyces bugieae]|uniref:Uncharacterized protein n=1 Tax=Streptomyces bugieae TaxID=3098223 RepID=A0ABU7NN62_9ACTN|nr:hypothetical protein [Streptomyces sp. DSM 41528]